MSPLLAVKAHQNAPVSGGISGGDFIPPDMLIMDIRSRVRLDVRPHARPRVAVGGHTRIPLILHADGRPGLLTGASAARIVLAPAARTMLTDDELAVIGGYLWAMDNQR